MKTLALIFAVFLIVSCEKTDDSVMLQLSIIYPSHFASKAEADKSKGLRPSYVIMSTDKGDFEFNLIAQSGGADTNIKLVSPGEYVVYSVKVYDSNNEIVYLVHDGIPDENSGISSWVDNHTHKIITDTDMIWTVILK